ncbi:aspartyl-phosphate phosphatase Spo0E family protein [Bacillus wiedmannii]|uniref:aspartyl-phosphate phosphatase Spo0E family protein n=1 Tax=Bacillus wiedmannii TaxID=1890302 RepID=UPI001CC1FCD2|nr:aspartyl-phosphate phosphatase Spo0E family protein [Bacillus wiedmannii]
MTTSSANFLQLHKQITDQKKKLNRLVRIHGYTHPLVLVRSQKLNQLVFHLMRYLSS